MLSILNQKQKLVSMMSKHRDLLVAALLSGVITGTSYIPFLPWGALFNYAPLWWYWVSKAQTRREIFWSGWWTQFLLNLIGFHWIFHTAHEFGRIPVPLSLIVLLLFASLAHLYVPLVGLILFEVKKQLKPQATSTFSRWSFLLVLVGLWSFGEIYWPSIFQWHMGYTLLWAKLPIYHWADVIGFQGLSLVLLLFNAFFVDWAGDLKLSKSQWFKGVGIALVIFGVLNGTGWYHGQKWVRKKWDRKITFLPIQANIGNAEKVIAVHSFAYQDVIVKKFIEQSRAALRAHPEAQIFVWPESAIPDVLDTEYAARSRPQMIRNFLFESQRYLITGAYSKTVRGQGEDQTYNALFIFNRQGDLLTAPYRKKHLLAFGEFTPFADWFPSLNEISPAGKGFSRGPGPQALTLKDPYLGNLKVAPQICYEALYPEFTRRGVQGGAQVLINLTNDSWFGPYTEPHQHLSMTFARAIENRRPLIRVTNTGITSAIEASGKTLAESPLFTEWSDTLTLNYQEKPSMTLYTRYGGFWPFIVLWLTLGGLFGIKTTRKNRNPLA